MSKDRNPLDLLGFSLDNLVPKDAKCRFVVDILSYLDLIKLYQRSSSQGNDAYDPMFLLSTCFMLITKQLRLLAH